MRYSWDFYHVCFSSFDWWCVNNKLRFLNFRQLVNKYFKNEDGFDFDLLSIDIQRGKIFEMILIWRNFALVTIVTIRKKQFLDAHRKCNFSANFKTSEHLQAIFPQSNVNFLKETYESIEVDVACFYRRAIQT